MKKNTRRGKTIKKKTNGNTIERKGGRFDSLEAALRERSNTKVGSKTRGRTPGRSRPLGRTPSVTQQKRKGAWLDSPKVASREMSSTKGGSRKTIKNIRKLKTTRKKTISNTTKKEGGGI